MPDGGTVMDAGDAAGDGSTIRVVARNAYQQAPLPALCGADGSCPSGQVCFHLAAELAVCDVPYPPSSDQCAAQNGFGVDKCGCNGLACGPGRICREVSVECSCGPGFYNDCVDTACSSSTDCPSGSVCTPPSFILPVGAPNPIDATGRCFTPFCTSDSDCVDGSGGRCALLLTEPQQAGQTRLTAVRCVYPGVPDATACGGTGAASNYFSNYYSSDVASFYACPSLAH
jgi:hypothetical protein